jgi:hypothetical protein
MVTNVTETCRSSRLRRLGVEIWKGSGIIGTCKNTRCFANRAGPGVIGKTPGKFDSVLACPECFNPVQHRYLRQVSEVPRVPKPDVKQASETSF